ncbi:hypothetical protein H2200_012561 [Cladophialophora chaetospira]|uniref:DUF1989 domain-containing protein n=1 Tax=Cladophialophora chaetospira TaxID=386627 RepID=A0AA39CC39_9EURO|nr:hypothetical protein H2200_012561 [Cladophialophora chaetospira]
MPPSSPYSLNTTHTIPARSSVAVPLSASQKLTVINTHGTQVVDFWALELPTDSSSAPPSPEKPLELTTYLSMSHTRAALLSLSPVAPCTLYTSKRSPILKFISDTSGGIHDTIIAACDIHRYRQLGVPEGQYHENCSDNLRIALQRDTPGYILPAPFNTPESTVPDPFNLFMNIPVKPRPQALHESNTTAGGTISFQPTVSGPGGKVVFEVLVDCIVGMSCCPQDLVPINHGGPTECQFIVEN